MERSDAFVRFLIGFSFPIISAQKLVKYPQSSSSANDNQWSAEQVPCEPLTCSVKCLKEACLQEKTFSRCCMRKQRRKKKHKMDVKFGFRHNSLQPIANQSLIVNRSGRIKYVPPSTTLSLSL
ncbi:unnamed protein product [Ilex paraguariensis]|uniref:Uncharacterized protein n=1 Tax=Ilex paraguariensis TaxID=185542 RepID=A0ABC8QTT9_9AQUA